VIKFSIITVCKNNDNTIGRTLCSVINQKYVHYEHIIIDGKSTDRTFDIINKYNNNNMIVISESDRGIADAFNKGLLRATGDIVGFLNSDDWYANDGVLKLINDMYSGENTVLCGSVDMYTSDNKYIKKRESYPSKIRHGMYIQHPASFVPLKLIRKVGLFDHKYKIAMDFDYFTRLMFCGAEFKKISQVITCMQTGGVSSNILHAIKEDLSIKNKYYGPSVRTYIHYYLSCIIGKSRLR